MRDDRFRLRARFDSAVVPRRHHGGVDRSRARTGERLRRDTRKLVRNAIGLLVFSLVEAVTVWLARTYHRWPPFARLHAFYYVAAVVLVIASVGLLVDALLPFTIKVDDLGMSVRVRRIYRRFAWQDIDRVTVEPGLGLNDKSPWQDAQLVIWPVDRVRLHAWVSHHRDGRKGYRLLKIDDFTVPGPQVVAILSRYGVDKVDAKAYLIYLDSRRRIAETLREMEARKKRRG